MAHNWWREPDPGVIACSVGPRFDERQGCAAMRMWRNATNTLVAPDADEAWTRVLAASPPDSLWHSLTNCVAYQAGVWQNLLNKGMDDVLQPAAFKLAIVLRHTPSELCVRLLAELLSQHPQAPELTSYILALLTDDEAVCGEDCSSDESSSYTTIDSDEEGGDEEVEGEGDESEPEPAPIIDSDNEAEAMPVPLDPSERPPPRPLSPEVTEPDSVQPGNEPDSGQPECVDTDSVQLPESTTSPPSPQPYPGAAPLRDLQLFGDCELAVLAASREEYDAHAKLVRAEYSQLTQHNYVELRIKVLNQFSHIPKLYHTPEFECFESAARENIEREICTLREHLLTGRKD